MATGSQQAAAPVGAASLQIAVANFNDATANDPNLAKYMRIYKALLQQPLGAEQVKALLTELYTLLLGELEPYEPSRCRGATPWHDQVYGVAKMVRSVLPIDAKHAMQMMGEFDDGWTIACERTFRKRCVTTTTAERYFRGVNVFHGNWRTAHPTRHRFLPWLRHLKADAMIIDAVRITCEARGVVYCPIEMACRAVDFSFSLGFFAEPVPVPASQQDTQQPVAPEVTVTQHEAAATATGAVAVVTTPSDGTPTAMDIGMDGNAAAISLAPGSVGMRTRARTATAAAATVDVAAPDTDSPVDRNVRCRRGSYVTPRTMNQNLSPAAAPVVSLDFAAAISAGAVAPAAETVTTVLATEDQQNIPAGFVPVGTTFAGTLVSVTTAIPAFPVALPSAIATAAHAPAATVQLPLFSLAQNGLAFPLAMESDIHLPLAQDNNSMAIAQNLQTLPFRALPVLTLVASPAVAPPAVGVTNDFDCDSFIHELEEAVQEGLDDDMFNHGLGGGVFDAGFEDLLGADEELFLLEPVVQFPESAAAPSVPPQHHHHQQQQQEEELVDLDSLPAGFDGTVFSAELEFNQADMFRK